jgi:hypothetical protein
MVTHAFKLGTQEADAGGMQVSGQPELYSKTLSQKSKGIGCSSVVGFLTSM